MKNLVMFDMDGVISDTQKYHAAVEIAILAYYGITTISPMDQTPISVEYINHNFAGVQPKVWMHALFVHHHKEHLFDIHQIEEQKNAMLLDLYKQQQVQAIPGAIDFIRQSNSDQYVLAVITASTRDCMIRVLEQLDLVDQFASLTSLYDIDPTTWRPFTQKSSPEVFYQVLDTTKFSRWTPFPMIEDGNSGIQWAIAAGWYGVAYLGTTRQATDFPLAKKYITDFTKVQVQDILL